MKTLVVLGILCFTALFAYADDCQCDHTLEKNNTHYDGQKMGVKPGDRVCISAGFRTHLRLKNFKGTASQPIVFINCGGVVTIVSDELYGIAVDNSEHFKITGTGSEDESYGIQIIKSSRMGVQIGEFSTDFEVDHLEIANTGFAGVMAKTDPSCDNQDLRNFVQKNTVLHDLYIHDTEGEGMYIGYSWYPFYQNANKCNNQKLYPHRLEGVKIYNNIIENTGWDGMQVGCATKDVEIHHNIIKNYGLDNSEKAQWHNSGLQIGAGTTGKVYNNAILMGKGVGSGISMFGSGGNVFYNNIIAQSGSYGIYVNDKHFESDRQPYRFINNTIVDSKEGGIRISFSKSNDNLFVNNLIVNSNGEPLEGGNNRRKTENNLLYKTVAEAKFKNPSQQDYRLTVNSPAVNAGKNVEQYGIKKGYAGTSRPQGSQYDVGAYEFTTQPSSPTPNPTPNPKEEEEPTDEPKESGSLPNPDETDNVVLAVEAPSVKRATLYPNPTVNILYLNIPFAKHTQLIISDLSGKIYVQEELPAQFSHDAVAVSTERYHLPKGLYHLRLQTDTEQYFLRFYKQ